jgi:basic membrane lipoprotein Med (substrate-binding protein (PBP1-ABC) superfamily)
MPTKIILLGVAAATMTVYDNGGGTAGTPLPLIKRLIQSLFRLG